MADPNIDLDPRRAEVREWIARTWDPNDTVRRWWAALAEAGYAHPTWPAGLGGLAASTADARVIQGELARAGTVAAPTGGAGAYLAAPTLLVHGTAEQVQRYLPAIARGEEAWCQLFSEPSAGSDLAGLATRATPDGDGWVVTGQKVWSSSGDVAQRGLLLARTDTSVPKHEGITYFALDMDQPGIHSRPLRQMNGNASFSEVFIDGAWVGRDDVIGGVGKGWSVAQTTLAQERIAVATRTARGAIAVASGRTAGQLDRRIADVMAETAEQAAITGYAVPEKIMLGLARDRGLATDPIMRQRLARYHTANRLNRLTMQRFQAARGAGPGAEGSILKLLLVEICTTSRDLVFDILGAEATLEGPDAPMQGQIHRAALGSPGSRIGGGTDEVQRNVIGERALGLPREPQVDRGVPYRDLRVGTVARSAERDAG